jgi:hypothetical protein
MDTYFMCDAQWFYIDKFLLDNNLLISVGGLLGAICAGRYMLMYVYVPRMYGNMAGIHI